MKTLILWRMVSCRLVSTQSYGLFGKKKDYCLHIQDVCSSWRDFWIVQTLRVETAKSSTTPANLRQSASFYIIETALSPTIRCPSWFNL